MLKKSADRCLIVFAREPVKGQVKTRLAKGISDEDILELYKAFLKDTVDLARKVSCEKRILSYAPVDSCPYLKRIGKGFGFHRQKGRTLGGRMMEAFSARMNHFHSCPTVIIGTDSPHLPGRLVNKAFRTLEKTDIVLGPSEDGGFYLIGLSALHPEIFSDVFWGTSTVLKKVLRNIERQKLKVELLEDFFDIDTRKDLERLKHFLKNKKSCALKTRQILKIV